ncbi:hypothetical protein ACSU6B_02680 [Neobacillus sp. C211]|uniref:hypothetical protein n=1 Tax=unclassified Neobacillus TaxID=2675272 RepID=UPI00397B77DC
MWIPLSLGFIPPIGSGIPPNQDGILLNLFEIPPSSQLIPPNIINRLSLSLFTYVSTA